jgi:predicted transposase YdaD
MDISKQDIRKVARQALSAGKEETIMTLAEQLRQEGRQKGRQEGRQEERTELFNRLLRKRFGSVLDAHVQKRLQNATPDQIDRWFDRILEAGSIEDVLDDKP